MSEQEIKSEHDRFRYRAFIDDGYIKGFINPCLDECGTWYYSGFRDGFWDDCIPISEDKINQCTGLRDKNGVLIFDGDIVVYGTTDKKPFYAVCEFEGCGFGLRVYESKDFIWLGDVLAETAHLYEIIGNIYETPELLEQ